MNDLSSQKFHSMMKVNEQQSFEEKKNGQKVKRSDDVKM